MGVNPPGVKLEWDACDVEAQTLLLAYQDIRDAEELKLLEIIHGSQDELRQK